MDVSTLSDLIAAHKAKLRKYERQKTYYGGDNYRIYKDPPKESPDNRIPVPFARKAVNQICGYMGKPGLIRYSDLADSLVNVYDDQDEPLINNEHLTSVCTYGASYELHWTEGGKPVFALVPIEQAIPVYDNSLKGNLIEFVRYYMDGDTERADHYTSTLITKYALVKGSWVVEEETAHGYGALPVVEFMGNAAKANIFDHVVALIDEFDKLLSENVANELDRFAEAYLLLANAIDDVTVDANGETAVDRLKRSGVFQDLGEGVAGKVAYLTKQINDAFLDHNLDRIERLIYDMLGIIDANDDTLAATSGIALQYKLLPFEYTCAMIESYFKRGLLKRLELLASLSQTFRQSVDITQTKVIFDRNLPADLEAKARIAGMLLNVLSRESVIALFPEGVRASVEEEIARLDGVNSIDLENVPDAEMDTTDDDNSDDEQVNDANA